MNTQNCGFCGNQVQFLVQNSGTTLVIYGVGPMDDYFGCEFTPWYSWKDSIREVIVQTGVSHIGDYAFFQMNALEQIRIPGSVDSLGSHAVSQCPQLRHVRLPEGVRVLCPKVFDGCTALETVEFPATLEYINFKVFLKTALTDVYYAGSPRQWKQVRIAVTANGNLPLQQANLHCMGTDLDLRVRYADLSGAEAEAAQYLADWMDELPLGNLYGVQDAARAELAYRLLYRRAGSPGVYAGPADWAQANGMLLDPREILTGDSLNRLLRSRETPWCAGSQPLTVGQTIVVLAEYLQSAVSHADRYGQIVSVVREAITAGGDGKIHILSPWLFREGIDNKPGDCTLLVFPKGQVMLLDAAVGQCADAVVEMLRDLQVKRIDYLVISHPHSDHCGAMRPVIEWFAAQGGTVGEYWSSAFRGKDTSGEPAVRAWVQENNVAMFDAICEGETRDIDSVKLEFFNPDKELYHRDKGLTEYANNMSLGMKFTYGDSTYLTSGDLYRLQEEYVVEKYGDFLRCDVMKSNHHGIFTSSCPAWRKAVSPKIVLSENDDIGTTTLSEWYAHNGVAHYSTGLDGAVLISMDDKANYTVVCQKDSDLRKKYHGTFGR